MTACHKLWPEIHEAFTEVNKVKKRQKGGGWSLINRRSHTLAPTTACFLLIWSFPAAAFRAFIGWLPRAPSCVLPPGIELERHLLHRLHLVSCLFLPSDNRKWLSSHSHSCRTRNYFFYSTINSSWLCISSIYIIWAVNINALTTWLIKDNALISRFFFFLLCLTKSGFHLML